MPEQEASSTPETDRPVEAPESIETRKAANAKASAKAAKAEAKRLADPEGLVLDLGDGTIDVVPSEGRRPRVLMVDGRNWEHAGEDASGRWLYRPM